MRWGAGGSKPTDMGQWGTEIKCVSSWDLTLVAWLRIFWAASPRKKHWNLLYWHLKLWGSLVLKWKERSVIKWPCDGFCGWQVVWLASWGRVPVLCVTAIVNPSRNTFIWTTGLIVLPLWIILGAIYMGYCVQNLEQNDVAETFS